jgi:hypothetical protein
VLTGGVLEQAPNHNAAPIIKTCFISAMPLLMVNY